MPMRAAMFGALDPYHRIRAIVALVFLLTVAALAVASLHRHQHATRSAVSAVSTAQAGTQSQP